MLQLLRKNISPNYIRGFSFLGKRVYFEKPSSMKYEKINQRRRSRREVWELFSHQKAPLKPELFIECVIKKAQALFERYDTLYRNLGVTHPVSVKHFKILSETVEKIHFGLLNLCDLYKHEVRKVSHDIQETIVELIQKFENLAIITWKEWFTFSSSSCFEKIFADPELN